MSRALLLFICPLGTVRPWTPKIYKEMRVSGEPTLGLQTIGLYVLSFSVTICPMVLPRVEQR